MNLYVLVRHGEEPPQTVEEFQALPGGGQLGIFLEDGVLNMRG